MPPKSKKQKKLMDAVAHNPSFAKKAGIPQSVGREFEGPVTSSPPKPKKHKKGKCGC